MLSPRLENNLYNMGIRRHDFSPWWQFDLCHDGAIVYIAKRNVPRGVLLTNRDYWAIVTNVDKVEGVEYEL